jgi:carboxylesterase type B
LIRRKNGLSWYGFMVEVFPGFLSDLLYDGTNLARRGAVLVGVNHRLNVLGNTHLGEWRRRLCPFRQAGQLDIIFCT